MTDCRGVLTATMTYDRQPIQDLSRQAAPDLLLGLMGMRGYPAMFFVLRRERVEGRDVRSSQASQGPGNRPDRR
jgi:hypothetical protein